MKRLIWWILFGLILFTLAACGTDTTVTQDSRKVIAAVGIIPEATLVKAVAGDNVTVVTMVPPGNSPANYSPTSLQMQALSDADIYFTLRMPTEEANILPKLSDFNKDIRIVNLQNAVSQAYGLRQLGNHSHDEHEEHEAVDPHVWLSPKRAVVMVRTIANELADIDPTNKSVYQKNADAYILKLEALDKEIRNAVSGMHDAAFLIYHPSYGYFADDYGLDMVTIETDGKQVTAKGIQTVVDEAKARGIKTVFYQEEFDSSQAHVVAEELGGTAVKTAPLAEDYIQALRDFVQALTGSNEG